MSVIKKATVLFAKCFVISAVITQAVLFIGDLLEFKPVRYKTSGALIFLVLFGFLSIALLMKERRPRFPQRKASAILINEGYTLQLYELLKKWVKKCDKKGFSNTARLTYAEYLVSGGRIDESFEALSEINFSSLYDDQKRIFFNCCLYAALLSGDKEAAEKIYKTAKPWLLSSSDKNITSSIKNTLGFFEYTRGNLVKAEELLVQSIENARSEEVLCDNWLALSALYLDTDRPLYAKMAVENASFYASDYTLKQKLERAKSLVEEDYRQRLGA
ncbi:MAG: hypothetical protein LUE12_09270 [Ruminococcus sp.]|nr:hypothetical protein [Ruminococcus sp.]